MAGHGGDQQRAELGRHAVLAGGRCPGGQPLQRHGGFRTQLQQPLRVLPHHVEILPRHADEHQVGERFLGLRIVRQNALVQAAGLVAVPHRLQGGGLAEQRILVVGRHLQAALEGDQRRLGILQPQIADPLAEVRFHVLRVQRGGLAERFGGVVPGAQTLQADRQVEPSHGVLRFELRERAVGPAGFLVIAHFELDVRHGAVNLRRSISARHRALQLFERLIAFPRQVERYGARQETGAAVSLRIGFGRTERLHFRDLDGCGAHFRWDSLPEPG